jgi:neutral ceramidase
MAAWKKKINSLTPSRVDSGLVKVGWSKINITPDVPGPMAGYGKRRGQPFESVHDSVFVRAMSFNVKNVSLYIVAADLLIIPPNVTTLLFKKLENVGILPSAVHLSATHTHNSLGGWGKSITGRLFAGSYNENVEQKLASQFFEAILKAKNQTVDAEIKYVEAIDVDDIHNRLNGVVGTIDPEIRTLSIYRKDGKKAKIVSYSAHSTVLNSATMQLSRDYSGVLVDTLERNGFDFAMFMAGAVGSMGPVENGVNDFEEVKNQGLGVFKHLEQGAISSTEKIDLQTYMLDLPLREPNPKIFKNWGLRPWLFKILFGDEANFVKITKLNSTLIIGLPCDFSGELMADLDAYAKGKGLNLIVSSFNGGYMGYVTNDKHFDLDLYETTTMAWYGTENGAYFSEVIRDIIDKMA